MPLQRLIIQNVRNIANIDITPSSEFNIIAGENGAGKTSLLEAISLLIHSRSFRTKNFRRVISDGSENAVVFGKLTGRHTNMDIGIDRGRDGLVRLKVNGEVQNSSARVASEFPLQVINSESFKVLEGQSKVRRKLFDWLVFHVKHEFRNIWLDYCSALKNRNALLKQEELNLSLLEPWDRQINSSAELIRQFRNECFLELQREFEHLLSEQTELSGDFSAVKLTYRHGWDLDKGILSEQLVENYHRDRSLGYTSIGPHRSEFKITVDKKGPAQDVLSRGQQKTLITAFYIAQLKALKSMISIDDIALLIDDLPAELDEKNLKKLCTWLQEINCQSFISCILPGPVETSIRESCDSDNCEIKVFHVKHGKLNVEQ